MGKKGHEAFLLQAGSQRGGPSRKGRVARSKALQGVGSSDTFPGTAHLRARLKPKEEMQMWM